MSIDAGLSIVVSFCIFGWLFVKKVYPVLIGALDDHIATVKETLAQAEQQKLDAKEALDQASVQSAETLNAIEQYRIKSEEKINQLKNEHEKALSDLRQHYEKTLSDTLRAELLKQKEKLIVNVSDLLLKRLADEKLDLSASINIDPADISKLK